MYYTSTRHGIRRLVLPRRGVRGCAVCGLSLYVLLQNGRRADNATEIINTRFVVKFIYAYIPTTASKRTSGCRGVWDRVTRGRTHEMVKLRVLHGEKHTIGYVRRAYSPTRNPLKNESAANSII